jgi:hypothetical protein
VSRFTVVRKSLLLFELSESENVGVFETTGVIYKEESCCFFTNAKETANNGKKISWQAS